MWDTDWGWGTTIKCNGNYMWWQLLFLIPHILMGLTVLPTLNPRRMLWKTSPNVKLDFTKVVSYVCRALPSANTSFSFCRDPVLYVKVRALKNSQLLGLHSVQLSTFQLSWGFKLSVSSFNICACVWLRARARVYISHMTFTNTKITTQSLTVTKQVYKWTFLI